MSEIMSYSVGNGDMFYINHDTSNFTIIDVYFNEDEKKEKILKELKDKIQKKEINRFISTHPDEDHVKGLTELYDKLNISNFYCVKNEATKKSSESKDFKKYCELRDSKNTFNLKKGCSRKWMNISDETRGSSGISIMWPNTENEEFKKILESVKEGGNANNISPIIKYSLQDGIKIMWFGDLEADFLDKVKDDINFTSVDVVFAPHHGRKSGKLPKDILEKLDPKIIVIGEAPSENIDYYNSGNRTILEAINYKDLVIKDYTEGKKYYSQSNYNTITQNSAKDIFLNANTGETDIYVSSETYKKTFKKNVIYKDGVKQYDGLYYLCTIEHE